MPLAIRHRTDPAPTLEPLAGLLVAREHDAARMAALQNRGEEEMRRRFAAGHRAYVARRDGEPAAWGWVATRSAEIGELASTLTVPEGDRYLWNFVTLPAHRGLGVYPRLIEAIVRAESEAAARFWIAWAPENHASGAGIRRAGFVTVAELSFDADGRPAMRGAGREEERLAAGVLALPATDARLSSCWRCARAAARGTPMGCAAGECRCDYQRPETGCAA